MELRRRTDIQHARAIILGNLKAFLIDFRMTLFYNLEMLYSEDYPETQKKNAGNFT